MAKHKIVEKWAAGLESWSDRPMAVKAKLVETDNIKQAKWRTVQ